MSYIVHEAPQGSPRHGVDFVSQAECPRCRPGVKEAMRLLLVELSQEPYGYAEDDAPEHETIP